jgi:hypothetical protein
MKSKFHVQEFYPISTYQTIIKNASRRLRIWHNEVGSLDVRHQFMYREINLIRHCKKLINQIQEQLN